MLYIIVILSYKEYPSRNVLILRSFVCAAGPIDKALQDFWLMVWLQRANRIVMVTKLTEGGQVSWCSAQ